MFISGKIQVDLYTLYRWTSMKEIEYGSVKLPPLLCGSSPFMGAGQFGPNGPIWYQRFYHHPRRMAEIFEYFCELGFPGVQLVASPSILEAARLVKEKYSLKITVSLVPRNWMKNLEEVARLEPDVVFIHGAMTDNFLKQRSKDLLECIKAIRSHGAFPGIATHNPYQTLSALQMDSNPLAGEHFGLLIPINSAGFAMDGDISDVIDLLQKTEDYHPIMAMKVLAAGRLQPREAIEFVFRIKQVKVVAIGIVEKEEATEIASIVQAIHQ